MAQLQYSGIFSMKGKSVGIEDARDIGLGKIRLPQE